MTHIAIRTLDKKVVDGNCDLGGYFARMLSNFFVFPLNFLLSDTKIILFRADENVIKIR